IEEFGSKVKTNAEAALAGHGKWKETLKAFDESEFEAMDTKVVDQKLKALQKLLKPLVSIEEKIEEAKSEVKDIVQGKTQLIKEAQEMLLRWEQNDPETVALWKKMNAWVYEGFDLTYKKMGVDFDK